jgi:prefoldin alpha subunit
MLVPLSQSVYVDGFITKPDTVLVDIGTGYYVEKKIDSARVFLKKRVDMIQGNASKVNDLVKRKEQMMQDTQLAFQQKMAQMQQMNEGVAAAAGAA